MTLVIPCVLQINGSQGWATLDRFSSMTDAIKEAKTLTGDCPTRCQFRLLDGETHEAVSYFDSLNGVVHASSVR